MATLFPAIDFQLPILCILGTVIASRLIYRQDLANTHRKQSHPSFSKPSSPAWQTPRLTVRAHVSHSYFHRVRPPPSLHRRIETWYESSFSLFRHHLVTPPSLNFISSHPGAYPRTSSKLPRGKKKSDEQKAAIYEKRRIIRRARHQNPPVHPDAISPPLSLARREAIVHDTVSNRRVIFQPSSSGHSTVDKVTQEAEKIPKPIEACQDSAPAVQPVSPTPSKGDQERQAGTDKATTIHPEILADQKSAVQPETIQE